MTNNPEDPAYSDLVGDNDPAGARLVADLEVLFAVPAPDLQFSLRLEPASKRRRRWRWWRPALAAATAASGLAAALIVPSLWQTDSSVNAEAIFARASAAADTSAPAAGFASYHIIATNMMPGQPPRLTTTETWYADAGHVRTEHDHDAANAGADFSLLVSGDDAWLYGVFDGVYRAAKGPASELGTTFGDFAPGAAVDIGQVLREYTNGCQVARADGTETVAGRRAYKIVVSADLSICPEFELGKDLDKLFGLTVWVDQESYLPLKTEQQDRAGSVMYAYEVTQIDVGAGIPESTFTYQAPAGTTVHDVANLTEAKFVLMGYTKEGLPAP